VGKDPRRCIGNAFVVCVVHGGDCGSRQPVVAAFGGSALAEILRRSNKIGSRVDDRAGTGLVSQAVDFGDVPGRLCRRFIVSLGLERKCRLGGWPLETAREPCLEIRHCGKVHVDSAADDRGDVEIGHREVGAEQIFLLAHCRVEDPERRHENPQRLVALDCIALGWRQAHGMQRPDIDATIDLGDGPKAPLPRRRLAFERPGVEFAIVCFLAR